jgi:hypothetical protein
MSTANSHTPGPWSPFLGERAEYPGIDHDHGSLIIFGENGELCGIRGKTKQERQANAYLIAAAPDLLEALEEIVINAHKNYEGSMDIYPEAIEIAREAIRKAKGGQE